MTTLDRVWRGGFWCFAAQMWAVFGIALSNILLGSSLVVALRHPRRAAMAAKRRARLLVPLAWFAFLFLVSAAFSYEPRVSLPALDDLFSLLPVALALVFVRNEADLRRLVSGLIILGVGLSLWGFAQVLSGAATVDVTTRMTGPFSHYQTLAGVLMICDVLLLARMIFAGGWRRLELWAAAIIMTATLVANLTRGAWIAVGVAVLVMLTIRAPRSLAVAVPLLLLLGTVLPTPVRERAASIFDLSDESNYDRLCMVYAGGKMIRERPLFGLGPKMVAERYPIYRHPTAPKETRPHLHNSFLQIAAETGLLSLAAFVWMLVVSGRETCRVFKREGGLSGARVDLLLGGLMALLAYTVGGLFEDNWSDTEVQRVALFVIALPFCLIPAKDDGEDLSRVS